MYNRSRDILFTAPPAEEDAEAVADGGVDGETPARAEKPSETGVSDTRPVEATANWTGSLPTED